MQIVQAIIEKDAEIRSRWREKDLIEAVTANLQKKPRRDKS
jgi:hypothetical protein